MESNLVNDDSSNENGISSFKAINLIKLFFSKHFPNWIINCEYDKAGFWGIYFENDNTIVKIDSDRGGLECSIEIDGKVSSLWQFDKAANTATTATENNIMLILEILSRFFNVK